MRKLVLISAALLSFNCLAFVNFPNNFNSSVMSSFHSSADVNQDNIKLYGGRDFSRPLMANANEANYSNLPIFVG